MELSHTFDKRVADVFIPAFIVGKVIVVPDMLHCWRLQSLSSGRGMDHILIQALDAE